MSFYLWVKTFANEAERAIAASLRDVLAEQADEAVVRGISDERWLGTRAAREQIAGALRGEFENIVRRGGKQAARTIGVRIDDLTDRAKVQAMIGAKVDHLSRAMTDTSARRLRDIRDGVRDGSIAESEVNGRIMRAFGFEEDASTAPAEGRGRYDNSRANMVGETEGARALALGQRAAWIESGMVGEVQWVSQRDERTCDFCLALDGKRIDVDAVWFDKGDTQNIRHGGKQYSLKHDYDDVAGPPLHVWCRCTLRPVIIKRGRRK